MALLAPGLGQASCALLAAFALAGPRTAAFAGASDAYQFGAGCAKGPQDVLNAEQQEFVRGMQQKLHSEELKESCHGDDVAPVLLLQSTPAVLVNLNATRSHEDYHYAETAAEFFGAMFVTAVVLRGVKGSDTATFPSVSPLWCLLGGPRRHGWIRLELLVRTCSGRGWGSSGIGIFWFTQILASPVATILYMRWPKSQETWKPKATRDINSAVLNLFLLALCSLVLGIMSWQIFVECDYVTGDTSDGMAGEAGFGQIHVIGLAAALYLAPVAGVATLTATGLMLSQPSGSISEGVKVGWLCLLVAGSCVATGIGAHLCWPVLSCGILGCTGVDHGGGTVLGGPGLWIFWLGAGFTVVFVTILAKRVLAGQAPAADPPRSLEGQLRRQRAARLAAALSLALVVIPLLWVLTALLPNAFMYWMPTDVAESMAGTAYYAEDSSSWLQTGLIKLSDHYILKAYPDTTLFYGFLEVLALAAAALAAFPPLEKLLTSRRHPGGMSLGENLTVGLFAIMLVFWFIYWLQSHSYHYAKSVIDGVWLERIARTFGLTAVLFMGLNLFPACKKSLWHEAFGVSWERGLWTHRWLGGAAVAFMTLHILTMFCRYAQLGSFPYDAIHLHQFYPINKNGVLVAGLPDYDNFTIGTQMLVAYPALFIFGVLPLFRNKGWEIFKYTHFFFLVLIPATLLHAESSWYFLIGGVAFYLVDCAMRFVGVTSPTAVLLSAKTYEAEGGVVELQISKSHPYPGQFAWVNVPAVSTWEWHPFSLASSPSDGVSKMCIKNMGRGTFTDKLYQLVREGDPSALTVQLDGAYGPMFDPADHAAFLLIGGGIGITQVHSTLRTFSQMAVRRELPASLKMVRLVWIVRSPELFRVLDDSIAQCLQAEYPAGSPKFSVTFYATGGDQSTATFAAPLKKGRPSFPQIYSEAGCELNRTTLWRFRGLPALFRPRSAAGAERRQTEGPRKPHVFTS
ncbi:unnamed protein product [Prorocentrum cordatum]|uniref:FAD-binding FR-type domain-containing protein n=1 Tax=Prorocentrum cordatum TaxID=2364126 RepID=A0ABN9USE1_9DINO|nr:unnamed protein product [Polarella glacialis]